MYALRKPACGLSRTSDCKHYFKYLCKRLSVLNSSKELHRPAGMTNLVFTYGTLKRGFPNHYLIEDKDNGGATFIGDGKTVEKYPLVVLPFAEGRLKIPFVLDVRGSGHQLQGEIWQVDEKMLATLDRLEDYPDLYDKKTVEITNTANNNEVMSCAIYILTRYRRDLLDNTFIASYTQEHANQFVLKDDRTYDIKAELYKIVKDHI